MNTIAFDEGSRAGAGGEGGCNGSQKNKHASQHRHTLQPTKTGERRRKMYIRNFVRALFVYLFTFKKRAHIKIETPASFFSALLFTSLHSLHPFISILSSIFLLLALFVLLCLFLNRNNLILFVFAFLIEHKYNTTQPSKQPSNSISNTGHISYTHNTAQPNT